jgi:aspartate/methionine/tyrosine aminotransferase
MPQIGAGLAAMPPSGIRAITNRALAVPGVIRLEIGEPDFGTPDHIVEAAHRAAQDGYTRYTETQGLRSLREVWTERLRQVNGCAASAENLTVTAGATAALFATFASILEPGDEVMLPDPGWPNWTMMARMIGAADVGYRCSAGTGWLPDMDDLQRCISPRTRAILVNSPANPTGAVLDRAAMRALAKFAQRHDLWLISDECYDGIVFDGEHVGAASVGDPDRTVTVVSCSKTYAMTGWRVGCVAAPAALTASIAKVQQATQASVCAVAQKAAEAALSGPQECVAAMRDAYRSRRDLAVGILAEEGYPISPPQGAFYAMLDLSAVLDDSMLFALDLLERHKVAVAPGAAFGNTAPASLRIALCAGDDALREGLPRLCSALNAHRSVSAEA